MKTEPTPGPWHVGDPCHEYKQGYGWHVPVWADNGPEGGKIAAESFAPTREQARDNAQLIASVHDLLSSCRELEDWVDGYACYDTNEKSRQAARAAQRRAVAVILQATERTVTR